MSIIEEMNLSYKYVVNNSIHVKINYTAVDKMIKIIKNSNVKYWLETNPFGVLDMELEDIINFLLIYHTIGDYCFWGEPKWEIETEYGKLDGSYAIMNLIINRYKENQNFDMSYEEFKSLLKGNVEIPLLENRYNNLAEMNRFLKKSQTDFFKMIKDMYDDVQLFTFIVESFPYFQDESEYDGHKVYFYKRAQLLTSDILHVIAIKKGIKTDYSHLIGCADYKIPQVMRCYNMLEFDKYLENKIDSKEEIKENSKAEIEIRACDLEVINYIYEKLERKYPKMDINDYIWLLGQDKSKMTKLYHRTLTSHY